MGKLIQNVALSATAILAGLIQLLSSCSKTIKKNVTIVTLVATTVLVGHSVSAQLATNSPSPPGSLKSVPIPEPDNLKDFIKDKTAAIALGKTLFWDMQVGSDGIQSCATCHFHAGADNRSKNQINPGPDQTFTTGDGPNYKLSARDYPFHNLTDPDNRQSPLYRPDSNNITGSQGVHRTDFVSVTPGNAKDNVSVVADPVFNINGINTRQVTSRNTPTNINAVFNYRNFWDGRSQNDFNGVNPFGKRDPNATLFKAVNPKHLEAVQISLNNSSLASQAVGPPNSAIEESSTGRIFSNIGDKLTGIENKLPRAHSKKLRKLVPLGKQLVTKDDSVLGNLSRFPQKGLKTTYQKLIKQAFHPVWWKSNKLITISPNGERNISEKSPQQSADEDGVVNPDNLPDQQFTLLDYNFSLFMGLAIQMYESTLVSDHTPYDQYQEGNSNALTAQQQQGLNVFLNSSCIGCHAGAEFTAASVTNVQKKGRITRAPSGAFEDTGFFNIGISPAQDDLGVGANDSLNPSHPLSETRLAQQGTFQQMFGEAPNLTVSPTDTVNADGSFKAPGLRNVELTAPYFHNGGKLTLRQVVDFYSRGGGDADPTKPAPLRTLNLSEDDKQALVAFLKSLTDERVRYQRAPFDHPELFVPNGHPGNTTTVTNDGSGQATDSLKQIPAVGKNGTTTPEANFLNQW